MNEQAKKVWNSPQGVDLLKSMLAGDKPSLEHQSTLDALKQAESPEPSKQPSLQAVEMLAKMMVAKHLRLKRAGQVDSPKDDSVQEYNQRKKAMKKLILCLVGAVLVGCSSVPAGNANWRDEGYNRQGQVIAELVESKQITRLEGLRRMVPVTKTYFPEDPLLLGVWTDLIQYAEQVERGELTNQKYRELFEARWALFDDANKHRHAEHDAMQARNRQSQFVGDFLGNMARSIQRTNPPAVNCTTTAMPGVLTTNCR